MLRISQTATTETRTTLRLEGEINGRWVEELRKECVRTLDTDTTNGRRLVLDVGEVTSIDVAGLALLRELGARRVLVRNASLYVSELLKGIVDADV
jgi:anti-anti-sigma factor